LRQSVDTEAKASKQLHFIAIIVNYFCLYKSHTQLSEKVQVLEIWKKNKVQIVVLLA
jgi:hypothetical protein